MMQDGRVVTVGDAVELCLMPGDQAPRVARLQALWSQAANGGCKHMLAQCALFYRPSVRLHAAHLLTNEPQITGRRKLACRYRAHTDCSSSTDLMLRSLLSAAVADAVVKVPCYMFSVTQSSSTVCQGVVAEGRFSWHLKWVGNLQETGYYGSNASNELFASTHIEERLPLQRISAPCTVDMADGSKRGVHVAGTADYVCTFLYDHRTDQLGRLPGV